MRDSDIKAIGIRDRLVIKACAIIVREFQTIATIGDPAEHTGQRA
jgi:hypothetical protein